MDELLAGALGGFTVGAARFVLTLLHLTRDDTEKPKWGQLIGTHAVVMILFAALGMALVWALTGPSGAFAISMSAIIALSSLVTAGLGHNTTKREIRHAEAESSELVARVRKLQQEATDAQHVAAVHKDQAEAIANLLQAENFKAEKRARTSNFLYFLAGILASIAITLFVRPLV